MAEAEITTPSGIRVKISGTPTEAAETVERLEKSPTKVTHSTRSSARELQPGAETLPAKILSLQDIGFLNEARTPIEVHAELSKVYPCEINRVQMALLRLQRKREVRRVSKDVDGKKTLAYAK